MLGVGAPTRRASAVAAEVAPADVVEQETSTLGRRPRRAR